MAIVISIYWSIDYHVEFIILRKDKMGVDGKCPLNVQVTINSKVMKLPIGQKINPKFWDSKNHCCIGKGFGELKILLDETANRLRKFCLTKIAIEEPLNFDLIKDFHNGINLNCFYKVFDKVFEMIDICVRNLIDEYGK